MIYSKCKCSSNIGICVCVRYIVNKGCMDMEQDVKYFIAEYYRKYYRKLYIHAYSILGQSTEAEVAVQEAFLAACKKPDEFSHSQSRIGWLKKAVENEALHILRERKHTAALFLSLDELAPGQEPAIMDDSSFELTELCQRAVSKEELGFFLRIARHESTFPEEAKMQGIRLTTCYKRFERIRKKLQQALEDCHNM